MSFQKKAITQDIYDQIFLVFISQKLQLSLEYHYFILSPISSSRAESRHVGSGGREVERQTVN